MQKHAVILGSGSDIGAALAYRLRRDGWGVASVSHRQGLKGTTPARWDLVVCCYGTTEPIGSFWAVDPSAWRSSFSANLFLPLEQVRELYPRANPGASVCFFSGAGTSGPAPSYSAYATAKVALVKAVELMDAESPDCKFFIIGPGMVRTKLLDQALRAGPAAANFRRVADFIESGDRGTSPDRIYECLLACAAAPKTAVGGRNICAHLDDFRRLGELALAPDAFKLRRYRDGDFREES